MAVQWLPENMDFRFTHLTMCCKIAGNRQPIYFVSTPPLSKTQKMKSRGKDCTLFSFFFPVFSSQIKVAGLLEVLYLGNTLRIVKRL